MTSESILALPNELLIVICSVCSIDTLLSLIQTNRRLYQAGTNILLQYKDKLDDYGLHFISHSTGLDQTVPEAIESVDTRTQSWLAGSFKRCSAQLRFASGADDTFLFDDYMMRCSVVGGEQEGQRVLKLFHLDPTKEDPVIDEPLTNLELDIKREGLGTLSAECYDAGQDMILFAYKGEPELENRFEIPRSSKVSLECYSLRTLEYHPQAIGQPVTIPGGLVIGRMETVFICGSSIAVFFQGTKDRVVLVRWRGEPIFPAEYEADKYEVILHMAFLDENHLLLLICSRLSRANRHIGKHDSSLELRIIELQPLYGTSLTAFNRSYFSEGPRFQFPELKDNIYIKPEMSWILPHHPSSPASSSKVARNFKPSPYEEFAVSSGIFVLHIGGATVDFDDDEWQIQVVLLKSDLFPWMSESRIDLEWDAWGKEMTRLSTPFTLMGDNTIVTIESSLITWVEHNRAACISVDPEKRQYFHLSDYNPQMVRRLRQAPIHSYPGMLITESWILFEAEQSSPFTEDVITRLPFHVVELDINTLTEEAAQTRIESAILRICPLGVVFEYEDDLEEPIVGLCWVDDGIKPFNENDDE